MIERLYHPLDISYGSTAYRYCARTVIPKICPPFTESPFARSRRYPLRCDINGSHGKALPFRHRYFELMRQTNFLSQPRFTLVPRVFAGCCESLLKIGPSRRYLCVSFSTCLDPYPGCSCGARTRFFPQDYGLPNVPIWSALRRNPYYSNFNMVSFSELQSFTNVQTRGFARHPDCSYSSRYFG